MRQFYLLPIFLCVAQLLAAQPSAGHNYIITRTPLDEVADMNNPGNARVLTTVQYYDGLGRPSQSVQVGASPTGADLVGMTEYDGWGREYRQWLPAPVAGNGGAYVPGLTGTATTYYNDTKPYEETLLEQSPLNRTLGVKHPGYAFHNHPTGVEYGTNAAGEVKLMSSGYDGAGIQTNGYYAAGTLYKTTRTDEDGNVTHEYTDLLGQVVLTRQVSDGMNHDTYYVYDDFGNLVCVLPPLLADHVGGATGYLFDSDTWLKDYAYCYKYDYRNRCVQKRLPGCEWVYQVYDKADRLVLTQDGNQRAKHQWTVNKYDILGRLLYTGIIGRDIAESELDIVRNAVIIEKRAAADALHVLDIYTCDYFVDEITPTIIYYYDDYGFFDPQGSMGESLAYQEKDGYGEPYENATGLLTGTRTYLLDELSTPNSSYPFLHSTTAYYYDYRGRAVQERSYSTYLGRKSVFRQYDFGGNVTRSRTEYDTSRLFGIPTSKGIQLSETYRHTYDHAGRLVDTYHQVDGQPEVLLAHNEYDETGRLIIKELHNGQNTVSYGYNICNWPTAIEDGNFKESLFYHDDSNLPTFWDNLYNGNISSATYTSGGKSHTYGYSYDGLNRLLTASREETAYSILVGRDVVSYNEEFTYDKHGNVLTLKRNARAQQLTFPGIGMVGGPAGGNVTKLMEMTIDDLSFAYSGNQVTGIDDAAGSQASYSTKEYHNLNDDGDDFAYDANGNMTRDKDRGIAHIRYNLLNQPEEISFSTNGNTLHNSYWADGRKRSMTATTNTPLVLPPGLEPVEPIGPVEIASAAPSQDTVWREHTETTTYLDNLVYTSTGNSSPTQKTTYKLLTPEGYVDSKGNYYYYRRDHLGNVREVWKATDAGAQTVQRTRYYPSGLPWEYQEGDSASLQPYKYGGKEFVEAHGLDMYDNHARWYYATIMRTTTPDPLAEMYYGISPYAWCGNNPVRNVDPTGMDIWEMDYNGHVYWKEESDIHTLYALDAEGQRTGNSITLRNRNVFDNLANSGLNSNYTLTFSKGNPSELAAVFLFATDNSNAEWRFSRYDIGNGDQYANGTVHDSGLAISPEKMGFPQETEISFIHSHPTPYPTTTQEKESMGWVSEGKIWNPSDSYNVVKYSQQYKSYHYSYVYFPYTHNIYHVRGGRQPALIRNVLNHQYRPNSLFWGTLNGK